MVVDVPKACSTFEPVECLEDWASDFSDFIFLMRDWSMANLFQINYKMPSFKLAGSLRKLIR
jgi:hypothetical protein